MMRGIDDDPIARARYCRESGNFDGLHAELLDALELDRGRAGHIREVCAGIVARERLTDRAWLANTVLNILDGNIDTQIRKEIEQ